MTKNMIHFDFLIDNNPTDTYIDFKKGWTMKICVKFIFLDRM